MRAVWLRARSELRSRWRSLVSLALIAGIGGGFVIAALAGARRTDGEYPRFLKETRAYDLSITTIDSNISDVEQRSALEAVRVLPAVIDSGLTTQFNGTLVTPKGKTFSFPDVFLLSNDEGKIGTDFERLKFLRGRNADPAKVDEAVTNPQIARLMGIKVGDVLQLSIDRTPPLPPVVERVKLVGIGVAAGQVDPSSGGFVPLFFLTPAFFRAHDAPGERLNPSLLARVRGGTRGFPELNAEIARARLTHPVDTSQTQAPQTQGLARSTLFLVVGLRVFAGLAALAVLAIFGQLLARQISIDVDEQASLLALGMTRMQLAMLSLLRVAIVAVGAVMPALVLAFLLSPIAPIGPTRILELHGGFAADWTVFGIGSAGIVVLVLLISLVPAWRTSGAATRKRDQDRHRTARAANALARGGFPPPAVAGVRMALEPGHGETAVPVRTTIFGTVLALATLTAALSFSGSLHRLVTTPALAGWNWDAIVPTGPDALPPLEKRLVADNSVSSVGRGSMIGMGFGSSFVQQSFGNNSVFGMALDKGAIGPLVISGRLPTGSGEIALGPATYRSLHAQIGKTVPVIFGDPSSSEPLFKTPVHLRVVGVIAVPEFFFNIQPGGSGAAISMDELRAAAPSAGADAALFLRFAPGVSVADGTTRIKALLGPQGFVLQRTQATDQTNLKRLASLPAVLAGLLALLAAATLIHTLVSSVRRRRRDLAIMKTLGFVRSQVWLTVAWQATTIILISLALGLPLGAIAARWGWRAFVNPLGFVPQPVVPLLPILLSIPAALILANLIASFPARAAARTEPAVALRAE